MSKTLPDAIIAGMYGNASSVILVRIIPESADTWAELCWATKAITVLDWEGGGGSKSFAGNMLGQGNLGTIRESVNIENGGNLATVSTLNIRITNPEYNGQERLDTSSASYNLENREIEIWRAFWTGSNPAWGDLLLLHRFIIEDVEYDYDTYQIKCRDAGLKRHKDIPDLILNKDDYSVIPVYSRGRAAALVYGDLSSGDTTDPRLSTLNAAPAIKIHKGKEQFIIARNKVYDFSGSLAVYLYFSEVNRWARLTPVSGSFSLTRSRPSVLNFPLGTNILGKLETQLETQGSQTYPSSMQVKYAIDESWATVVELDSSVEEQLLYLKAPMPSEFGYKEAGTYTAKLYVQFGTISAGGSGRIKYYDPESESFSTGQVYTDAQSTDLVWYEIANKTWDQFSSYEYGVTCVFGTCEVANMYLVIENIIMKLTTDKVTWLPIGGDIARLSGAVLARVSAARAFSELAQSDNVTLNLKGGEVGSWIDADGRDNGYNEGNLANNAPYIIECILRDELGLVSAEIDYASFDVAGNTTDGDRKDWYFAMSVDAPTDSLKIISALCQHAGLIYLANCANKEKIVALKKGTAVKTIDRTSIDESSVKISLSEPESIFNDFYLNYNRSWTTGNYGDTLYLTSSGTNMASNTRSGTPNTYTGLCLDSRTKYNVSKRLTVNCDSINQKATAEKLLKWLAEWHCYRKHITGFSTGLEHIDLEMGDQIKIDHTLLPTGVSNDDCFVIFDIRHDLDNDRLTFKTMQIPDLLP